MEENNFFGQRTYLKDVLPLNTPYVAQFYLTDRCNFRCEFCSSRDRKNSAAQDMELDLYEKAIDGFKDFSEKLKVIWFAGQGEPLLHKDIVHMVEYAKRADIAENINIVTNASLLNKELSQGLIKAGVSALRVSINGLSTNEYKEHTGAGVCFEELVDNIAFFYDNCRGNHSKIYIKILDYMIEDPHKRQEFYKIFEKISHKTAIEHLVPIDEKIDYQQFSPDGKFEKARMSEVLEKSRICALPFYAVQIGVSGQILPCCAPKAPVIMGDLRNQNLYDIWNGEFFNQFRMNMLDGVRSSEFHICRNCKNYLYALHKEDVLDDVADQLKIKYDKGGSLK